MHETAKDDAAAEQREDELNGSSTPCVRVFQTHGFIFLYCVIRMQVDDWGSPYEVVLQERNKCNSEEQVNRRTKRRDTKGRIQQGQDKGGNDINNDKEQREARYKPWPVLSTAAPTRSQSGPSA